MKNELRIPKLIWKDIINPESIEHEDRRERFVRIHDNLRMHLVQYGYAFLVDDNERVTNHIFYIDGGFRMD